MSIEQVAVANPEVVRALMKRLLATLEQFAEEMVAKDARGLEYLDALMGFHNAYLAAILDLEARTEDRHRLWRNLAMATLHKALMERKPL